MIVYSTSEIISEEFVPDNDFNYENDDNIFDPFDLYNTIAYNEGYKSCCAMNYYEILGIEDPSHIFD